MDDKIPSVSIVIPTCNRHELLKKTLLSISRVDYPKGKLEVVVSDDGSSDATGDSVEEVTRLLPFEVTYVRNEHAGVSAAKNRGIEKSRGEILVFLDDDCTVEADWLKKLLAPTDAGDVGAVGGPDRAPADQPFFAMCVDYLLTSFAGTGGLRAGKGARAGRYYPKGYNVAVPRKVVETVGVFNEGLMAGEDIEFSYRIEKAGYRLAYAPEAAVWHARRASLVAHSRKLFRIGFNRARIGKKHAGLFQFGHMVPFLALLCLLVLAVFSLFFKAALVLLVLFLVLYALICVLSGIHAAIKLNDGRALIVIPFLLPLHHTANAIGFIWGLLFAGKY
jgi:GT2 family glycosyltransferase